MRGSTKTKLDELAYERDGFRCVECGETTGIEAHHIIPELEELDNLVTLCHACHKKRHNMAGCFEKGHKLSAKLDINSVKAIKILLRKSMTQGAIAKMFNISRASINDIANERTWITVDPFHSR